MKNIYFLLDFFFINKIYALKPALFTSPIYSEAKGNKLLL